VAETSIPSLRSSPTIRGYPQLLFFRAGPKDQFAHLAVDRRSTWSPVRVRPMAREELPMPAQQCLGPHYEGAPRATRKHPAERRKQQAVALRELRPPDAMVAAALIDRLVHHATMIMLKGKSYRLRERGLGVAPAAQAPSLRDSA
jgi:hypothetical protein